MSVSPAITPSTAISQDTTNKKVVVSSSTYQSQGVYTVTLTFTNPISTTETYSFSFTVTIKCKPTITASTTSTPLFYYSLQSMQATFDYSQYFSYSNNCGNTFTYSVLADGTSSPHSFVTSTGPSMIFKIQTEDDSLRGVHVLTSVATLNDEWSTKNTDFQILVEIQAPHPVQSSQFNEDSFISYPRFEKDPLWISIQAENPYLYNLPKIIYSQPSKIEITYQLGYMRQFTVKKEGNVLEIRPNKNQTGFYKLQIKLTDKKNSSISRLYDLQFLVYYKKPTNLSDEQIYNQKIDRYESEQYFLNLSKARQEEFSKFEATVTDINIFGEVRVKVNQDLIYDSISSQFKDALLRVYHQPYLEVGQNLSSWKIIKYDNRIITLQLSFSNTFLVSSYPVQDKIRVEIVRHIPEETRLRTLTSTNESKIRNFQIISSYLPNQVDPNQKAYTYVFGVILEALLYILLGEAVVLGFFVRKNIYSAWGALMSFQLAISLPLINKEMPSIVLYFNSFLVSPLNLDLRNISPAIDRFFILGKSYISNSQDEENIPLNFKFLGVDTIHTMAVLQSCSILFSIGLIILALIKLVIALVNTFKNSFFKIQRALNGSIIGMILKQVYSQLRFNYFVRLFLIFYLQMSIAAFQTLFLHSSNISSTQQRLVVNVVASVLVAALIVFYPLFLMYKISSQSSQVKVLPFDFTSQIRSFRDQFGTLFENHFLQSKSYNIFYSLFFVRRLAFGLFLPWLPFQLQIGVQLGLTYVYIWVVTQNKPYLFEVEHKLSLLNEVCYLVCLLLSFIMSQIQLSYLIKFYFGCMYMAVVALAVSINFGVINIQFIDELKRYIRLYRGRKRTVELSQTQEILVQTTEKTIIKEKRPTNVINKNYKQQLFAAQYGADTDEDTEQRLQEDEIKTKSTAINFKPTRLFLTERIAQKINEKATITNFYFFIYLVKFIQALSILKNIQIIIQFTKNKDIIFNQFMVNKGKPFRLRGQARFKKKIQAKQMIYHWVQREIFNFYFFQLKFQFIHRIYGYNLIDKFILKINLNKKIISHFENLENINQNFQSEWIK